MQHKGYLMNDADARMSSNLRGENPIVVILCSRNELCRYNVRCSRLLRLFATKFIYNLANSSNSGKDNTVQPTWAGWLN